MGWLTGLEPATPGVTVQCSTIELQPPYARHRRMRPRDLHDSPGRRHPPWARSGEALLSRPPARWTARPYLSWIERQPSKLDVAGSNPAGRASLEKVGARGFETSPSCA